MRLEAVVYYMVIRQQTGPTCHNQCHPNIWSESYLEGFPCTSAVRWFNFARKLSKILCNNIVSVWSSNIKDNRKFLILILTLLIYMIYDYLHDSLFHDMLPIKWILNIQLISCGSKRADFCGMLRYIEKKLITLRLKYLLGRICRWHFTFELVIVSPQVYPQGQIFVHQA